MEKHDQSRQPRDLLQKPDPTLWLMATSDHPNSHQLGPIAPPPSLARLLIIISTAGNLATLRSPGTSRGVASLAPCLRPIVHVIVQVS